MLVGFCVALIISILTNKMSQGSFIFDLCVISYSDLLTDARCSNFIEFNRKNNLSVSTISISNNIDDNVSPNWICKVNPNTRFIFNYINFLKFAYNLKNKVMAKVYYASDLYSLIVANIIKRPDTEVIYDSREIFSALGTLSKSSWKQKIWSYLEIINVRNIKDIVVSGELDAEYLNNYLPSRHNYHIIKNFPNLQPVHKNNYLRDYFNISEDKHILIYQGVLLEGRGILPTLKFIKTTDELVLVLIGDGAFKSDIEKIIKEEKLENKVFIHNQVPYNQLLSITASADIGLSLIEPISFSYTLALPNKLFEYVLAGLPVLVSDLPAMKDFVTQTKAGEVVNTDLSIEHISEQLNKIISNYNYYISNVNHNKKYYTYNSQANNIINVLISLYKQIL